MEGKIVNRVFPLVRRSAKEFPQFGDGDVWIRLKGDDFDWTLLLHSGVLMEKSLELQALLEEECEELDEMKKKNGTRKNGLYPATRGIKEQYRFFLNLESVGDDEWRLVRRPFTYVLVLPAPESGAVLLPEPAVLTAVRNQIWDELKSSYEDFNSDMGESAPIVGNNNNDNSPSPPPSPSSLPSFSPPLLPNMANRTMDLLRRLMTNEPVDFGTNNFRVIIQDCHNMLLLASQLGHDEEIKPRLIRIISRLGRAPWFLAAADAPTMAQVAVTFQQDEWLSAAVTHMAGSYPNWRWATPLNNLSLPIQELVREKSRGIQQKIRDTNEALFTNNIIVFTDQTILSERIQSWFVIQCFNEWLRGNLIDQLAQVNLGIEDNMTPNKLALFYRTMQAADDSYLPLQDVLRKLYTYTRVEPSDQVAQTVAGHLTAVKHWAQFFTEEITENNTQLTMEELNGLDCEYLLCAKVEAHEMPWRDNSASG